jgi:hypothetical protein
VALWWVSLNRALVERVMPSVWKQAWYFLKNCPPVEEAFH